MKSIFLYFLFVCLTLGSVYAGEKEPARMRILYIGGNSDWNPEAKGLLSEAEFRAGLQKRQDAFAALLRRYFASVTVIAAADYTPELSDEYDVTIFDGLPPVLEQKSVEYDAAGRVKDYIPARYLPDDFAAPCITIGEVCAKIGQRLGIKNDWFCLCLDAHAHHIVSEHPIFHEPFPVALTLEKRPTPEEAFYYQHLFDEQIPDSLSMWRVQTKGYKSDIGFGIGLVSHPWGYTDSPDCEYISSGVCAKSPDAVAIGRHGNFMTWGFIASPLYMTDEAKTVFVNAVVYMARFRGAPLVRKYNANVATRTTVQDMKYAASRASYDNMLKYMNSIKQQQQTAYEEVKAKRERGEQLSAQEAAYLQSYQPMEVVLPPFAEHLKKAVDPQLYERFGEDERAYARYYDEHAPYYYGGEGQQQLTLDEDAVAWKIANNDKKILDKAISCLERGEDMERARRILTRYTLCDFATPDQWRKWYDKYHDKMFFTESGGWFFMIDGSRNMPGNDYAVLERRKARSRTVLSATTSKQADSLRPNADNPVVVTAAGKMKDAHTVEVSIVIDLYNGFHIYKEVGAGDPYVPISIRFDLTEGCTLAGDIFMPPAAAFGSNGTRVYERKVVLLQTIRCMRRPESLKFTLGYQCCDDHVCMPPLEKEFEVKIDR